MNNKKSKTSTSTSVSDLVKPKKTKIEISVSDLIKSKKSKVKSSASVSYLIKSKMDNSIKSKKPKMVDLIKSKKRYLYPCLCICCNGTKVDFRTQENHTKEKSLWNLENARKNQADTIIVRKQRKSIIIQDANPTKKQKRALSLNPNCFQQNNVFDLFNEETDSSQSNNNENIHTLFSSSPSLPNPSYFHIPAPSDHGSYVRNTVIVGSSDIPATRKLFGHESALMKCHRCEKRSVYSEEYRKNHYRGVHTYELSNAKSHRKHAYEWLQCNSKNSRENHFKEYGIRWSELLCLPYMDPIRFAVVDPMHCLFLGVAKWIIKSIFVSQGKLSME
ncbi:unnamed protein product [Rhizophagus irregularis]|nr:unnamed protein product [Rhizophagus irregularis]CAB5394350.1 unnamed protein product [Rhizophagus irregularis]